MAGYATRFQLYFHTLRHLRPGQMAHQLRRRLFPPRPPRAAPAISGLRANLRHEPFLATPAPADGRIRFLKAERRLDPAAPDWVQADAPKLWRYNLHYFDYLGWPSVSAADKAALVDDWLRRVPVGVPDAWEPYPVSLRIVNWLKHALALPPGAVPPAWLASLAHQAAALEGDLEYHLLANHLLKNGKALVFAGACLEGPPAGRWLARGLDILLTEAGAQVLPDGGHVERSPMYHGIVLEDYLDVVNLLTRNPGLAPPDAVARLTAAARRAADFLRGILTGAGDIPLFNDAAFGITPPARELLAYAEKVLVPAPVGAPSGATPLPRESSPRVSSGRGFAPEGAPTTAGVAPEGAPTEAGAGAGAGMRICFPDTGYFGWRHGGDSLIIDCGPVGPDYQPGHAHCDTLSYELHVGGVPIVVDSGTFDYEPGEFRHYLRSTAAHNTVRLDGQEQSEIWGAFRVARRARPVVPALGDGPGGELVFTGAHDGYRRLPGRPRHWREVRMAPGRWAVRDVVSGLLHGAMNGQRQHRVESFLHLHPAVRLTPLGPREFRLEAPGGVALKLVFGPAGTLQPATGYYCPQFGERLASGALVLEHTGALPVELSYVFERL